MRWKALFGIIAIAIIILYLPEVVAQPVKVEKADSSQGESILQSLETQFKTVVKRVDPAVVVIKDKNERAATGVLYRPDGYILTTALVDYNFVPDVTIQKQKVLSPEVKKPRITAQKKDDKDTSEFTVEMADGSTHEAKLVGSDFSIGIAMLKIDAENLPTAEFGNSDALEKGSWVMVIGNSYGMSNSISTGIVSGLNRQVDEREMFQITAPINPGMSGAPIINSDGRVVGIVASTFRRAALAPKEAQAAYQKAINAQQESLEQAMKSLNGQMPNKSDYVTVTKNYQLQHANAKELASKLKDLCKKNESISIAPDEKLNNLVIEAGKPYHDAIEKFIEVLDKPQPVSQAELSAQEKKIAQIQRKLDVKPAVQKQKLEKTKETERNLKEMRYKFSEEPFTLSSEGMNFAIPINDIKHAAEQLIQHGKVDYGWLGVNAKAVPPAVQVQLGLEKGHGVLIESVVSSSPAEKAGLKQWDVILHFDDTEVNTPKTLQHLVRRTQPGQKASIKIIREGKPLTLTLELGTAKHR
jgi:S1-C subfamily serine protease